MGKCHPYRKSRRERCRRGIGVVVFLALIVVAVLFIFVCFQQVLEGVTRQRENLSSGRRAFYIANAAINEGLLAFKQEVNVPSYDPNSWFQKVRKRLSSDYDGLERKLLLPEMTKGIVDSSGTKVKHIDVAVWSQYSINKLPYEKVALLTITAVIEIPRRLPSLMGRYVRRNVQKTYELRQVLMSPPRPFDGFTFYLNSWGYLNRRKTDYEKLQRDLEKQRVQLQDGIRKHMDLTRENVQKIIEQCQKIVSEYEKAENKIRDKASGSDERKYLQKLKEAVDQKVREQGFRDYAQVENVSYLSADCWMDAAGYSKQLKGFNLPPFRRGKEDLDNPVYVECPTLQSDQLDLVFPDPPDVPEYPTFPSGTSFISQVDWEGGLTFLSSKYREWFSKRESQLPPYELSFQSALERHEALFKLVPNDWVKIFQDEYEPLAVSKAWKHKASYVFENQEEWELFIPKIGGVYVLNGVYHIDGAVKLSNLSYRGTGAICSSANLDIDGAVNVGDGIMTLVAGKQLYLNGSVQAGLVAANGAVRYSGNSYQGAAVAWRHSGDDFSATFDSNLASRTQDGGDALQIFWVNVAPYHLACNFIRN